MMHHKAPHRPWEPTEAHAAHSPPSGFRSRSRSGIRTTTRTDALHENQQRVAADLTNRDLKLPPPPGLDGARTDEVAGDQAGLGHDRP